MQLKDKQIVFYDDNCGLCDTFIKLLIRMDIKQLYFAPLHKDTYSALIDKSYDCYDSVIFYKSGTVYIKSQAVIEILSLKSRLFKILKCAPRVLADTVYDLVAKYRKRLFPMSSCIVPDERIREKFLK